MGLVGELFGGNDLEEEKQRFILRVYNIERFIFDWNENSTLYFIVVTWYEKP